MPNENISDRNQHRWHSSPDRERYGEERGGYNQGQYGAEQYGSGSAGQRGDYGGEVGWGRAQQFGQQERFGQQGRFDQESQWGRQGQGGFGQQGGYGGYAGYGPQGQDFGTGGFGAERYGPGGGGRGAYGQGGWERGGAGYGESMGFNEGAYGGRRGSHAGRGPKGYQRGDDRIKEDVCEAFTRNDELDPSEIEIRVERGEITLTGTVDSREAKRLAEDLAERCSGVKEVHNQLRVSRREGQQQAGLQGGQAEGRTRSTRSGSGAGTSS